MLGFVLAAGLPGCRAAPALSGPDAPVRPGLEVLVTDSLHLVQGRRVGLVTNAAAVDRRGRGAVEVLRAAGVDLVALYSPEHGFGGTAAPGEKVDHAVDAATGLPIYSLYGQTLAPTPAMLEGVGVLLVDLPDVGARYFTWLATTVEVMRSAAGEGIPVIVLDRPNPIGGTVAGNVLDTAWSSFIGRLAVPMRHGLTLGELSRLARADLGLATNLAVVPASGWRRDVLWSRTGLPFRAPSPNLRDLDALHHYPGTCLFEGTNLSVGRGTELPFHQVGAPWLDADAVLGRLTTRRLPGVRFEAVRFTPGKPGDGKYADTALAGVRLVLEDPATYEPVRTALEVLAAVREIHPRDFRFLERHFDLLAGGPGLRRQLLDGAAVEAIVHGWGPDLAAYRRRVGPVLLYP